MICGRRVPGGWTSSVSMATKSSRSFRISDHGAAGSISASSFLSGSSRSTQRPGPASSSDSTRYGWRPLSSGTRLRRNCDRPVTSSPSSTGFKPGPSSAGDISASPRARTPSCSRSIYALFIERKNPMAVVEAFAEVIRARPARDMVLVVKMSGADVRPEAAGDPRAPWRADRQSRIGTCVAHRARPDGQGNQESRPLL